MRAARWQIRFNYAISLLVSAAMLSWPDGRPSYVALETFGGLDVPWWVWPALLAFGAVFLLSARGRVWLTAGYMLTGILVMTIAVCVFVSIGPTVQLGPAVALVLGCMRQGTSAKSEAA
ncbi:hypothetical protein [Deinococcus alpinitundrae]|uniref:hypothetical protein n=1 Tax=Deinococcus alpinitundrae TaxID=468913 RepID=UPI0013798169|nr:hypothetical protein [Deinococcus alpinitundrae]